MGGLVASRERMAEAIVMLTLADFETSHGRLLEALSGLQDRKEREEHGDGTV
jgi:hypothetical protein